MENKDAHYRKGLLSLSSYFYSLIICYVGNKHACKGDSYLVDHKGHITSLSGKYSAIVDTLRSSADEGRVLYRLYCSQRTMKQFVMGELLKSEDNLAAI